MRQQQYSERHTKNHSTVKLVVANIADSTSMSSANL